MVISNLTQIKENMKAPRHPGTGEFPAHMASNAENVSISWPHHALKDNALIVMLPTQSGEAFRGGKKIACLCRRWKWGGKTTALT